MHTLAPNIWFIPQYHILSRFAIRLVLDSNCVKLCSKSKLEFEVCIFCFYVNFYFLFYFPAVGWNKRPWTFAAYWIFLCKKITKGYDLKLGIRESKRSVYNANIFTLTCPWFPQFFMVPMFIDKRLVLYPKRFKISNVYFNKSAEVIFPALNHSLHLPYFQE